MNLLKSKFMRIEDYILSKKRLIDRALDRYLPSSNTKPRIIHRAMRYSVFSGGKRIRPVLTLAGFEACGGRGNSIMPVACAIELIHTYTLIHDDLPCMDDDDFRRGKSSCHRKFNEAVALLAGDALLTLGFRLLAASGNTEIIREVSEAVGSQGTIGGQVVDIEGSRRIIKKSELDYIARNKTGALFGAACKAGAVLKGSGRKKVTALGDFGKYLGMTFQLVDDSIDKDGYVKAYDMARVKKMAQSLTEEAEYSLRVFDKKARRLSEIAELILHRKS